VTGIRDFSRRYALTNGVSPAYAHQLEVLTRRLPWTMEDLTTDAIDGYLTDALKTLSAVTVNKHRRMLVTLVRAAQKQGLASGCDRPIRRVSYTLPPVRAWSMDEMGRLLAVAAEMPGGTRRCPYRILLPAYMQVGFSTGLRRSDLLLIEHAQIRGNRIAIAQSKTRYVHVALLNDAALSAIASLPVCGRRIFGDLVSSVQIVRVMRRAVKSAGLCGTGKYLRRSSATYAEMRGIDATRQLGHRTADMKRFYLDEVLLSDSRQALPAITSGR
jgi:hypothetical protein